MIHHGDTEAPSKLLCEDVTEPVIGAAIEVHRALGPGLLESAYEECLCHELRLRDIAFERQLALPIAYKGIKLNCGYRIDMIIENSLIVEITTADLLKDRWQAGRADSKLQRANSG